MFKLISTSPREAVIVYKMSLDCSNHYTQIIFSEYASQQANIFIVSTDVPSRQIDRSALNQSISFHFVRWNVCFVWDLLRNQCIVNLLELPPKIVLSVCGCMAILLQRTRSINRYLDYMCSQGANISGRVLTNDLSV